MGVEELSPINELHNLREISFSPRLSIKGVHRIYKEYKYDGDKIDVEIKTDSGAEGSFKCMKIECEII